MPDHLDNVALSPVSPVSPNRARTTSLSFNNTDVVHQYGYTKHDGKTDATHGLRFHDPFAAKRQFSSVSGSMDPVSENEEREKTLPPIATSPITSPTVGHGPLLSPLHSHHQPERKTSFSQLFSFATQRDEGPSSKPSSRQGSKDYPRLAREASTERDERAALVSDDEVYGVYSSYMTQESPEMLNDRDLEEQGDLGSRPAIRPAEQRKPMGPR